MRIIHLSAEFAPIAKAGGLGDVIVGLVRKLTKLGHDATVILPKYNFLPSLPLKKELSFSSNTMWSTELENCHLLLLETHEKKYFDRGVIYGEPDDAARFLHFSKACIEYLKIKNEAIDVLHLHDWHTATAAALSKETHLPVKKVVLTLHNAEYQGRCAPWDLDAIGLNGHAYLTPEKMQDDQYPNAINLLKGGIVFADIVNAVSPTYAKEILTPEIGGALSSTFRKYKDKLFGILNGIDEILWNPAKDPAIHVSYSGKDSPEAIVHAKEKEREALRETFHLEKNNRPWFGAITRLVPQKGPELLEEALHQTLEQGGSFFLLGSSPIPSLQHHFDHLKQKYAGNKNVFLCFEYNEALAHRLYAALDFLIMPSHFEPCGLSQLIAMRYGTIPIVRKTGGLQDTVFDGENGIVFEKATKSDLTKAMEKAMHLFNTKEHQAMMKKVMLQDFSWDKPTEKYLKLYR